MYLLFYIVCLLILDCVVVLDCVVWLCCCVKLCCLVVLDPMINIISLCEVSTNMIFFWADVDSVIREGGEMSHAQQEREGSSMTMLTMNSLL